MNLTDYNVVTSVLRKNGFKFSKSFGQNFIINDEICPRMAALCGADKSAGVFEIGPGLGVLTKELCLTAGKVVAIEIDERLKPVLAETVSEFSNLKIIFGDVLKLDLSDIIKSYMNDIPLYVCANLPYYLTSPIIMMLLQSGISFNSMTFMVQKEAAERICAEVGTRQSGAITVAVNYYAESEIMFDVPRDCFLPSPNVDSCVIKLTLRKKPEFSVSDTKKFFEFVTAAFSQRRKTAVNSISSGLQIGKDTVTDAFGKCGVDISLRPENLSMEQLVSIFNTL